MREAGVPKAVRIGDDGISCQFSSESMDGCHGPGRVPALSKPPPIAPLEIAVASITEGSEWHESLAAAIRRRVRLIPAPLDRGLLGVLLGGDC